MFAACHMLHLCTHVDVIKLVQQVLSLMLILTARTVCHISYWLTTPLHNSVTDIHMCEGNFC